MEEDCPESGFVKSDHNDVVDYGTDILCDDHGDHNGYPDEQYIADLKLVAAAPELLEAHDSIFNKLQDPNFLNFLRLAENKEAKLKLCINIMTEIINISGNVIKKATE